LLIVHPNIRLIPNLIPNKNTTKKIRRYWIGM
jgi:hypothetical protein